MFKIASKHFVYFKQISTERNCQQAPATECRHNNKQLGAYASTHLITHNLRVEGDILDYFP